MFYRNKIFEEHPCRNNGGIVIVMTLKMLATLGNVITVTTTKTLFM